MHFACFPQIFSQCVLPPETPTQPRKNAANAKNWKPKTEKLNANKSRGTNGGGGKLETDFGQAIKRNTPTAIKVRPGNPREQRRGAPRSRSIMLAHANPVSQSLICRERKKTTIYCVNKVNSIVPRVEKISNKSLIVNFKRISIE